MSKFNNYGLQICDRCEDEIYDLNNSPDSDLCVACYCKLINKTSISDNLPQVKTPYIIDDLHVDCVKCRCISGCFCDMDKE